MVSRVKNKKNNCEENIYIKKIYVGVLYKIYNILLIYIYKKKKKKKTKT
jgi:hypothetical protein